MERSLGTEFSVRRRKEQTGKVRPPEQNCFDCCGIAVSVSMLKLIVFKYTAVMQSLLIVIIASGLASRD